MNEQKAPESEDWFVEGMTQKLCELADRPPNARNLLELERTAHLFKSLLSIWKDPTIAGKGRGFGQNQFYNSGNITTEMIDLDAAYVDTPDGTNIQNPGMQLLGPRQKSETFGTTVIREAIASFKELAAALRPSHQPSVLDTVLAIEHAQNAGLHDVAASLKASLEREGIAISEPTAHIDAEFEGDKALVVPLLHPDGTIPTTPAEAKELFNELRREREEVDQRSASVQRFIAELTRRGVTHATATDEDLKAALSAARPPPGKATLFFEELSRRGVVPSTATEDDIKAALDVSGVTAEVVKAVADARQWKSSSGVKELPPTPDGRRRYVMTATVEQTSSPTPEHGVTAEVVADDAADSIGLRIKDRDCPSEHALTQSFEPVDVVDPATRLLENYAKELRAKEAELRATGEGKGKPPEVGFFEPPGAYQVLGDKVVRVADGEVRDLQAGAPYDRSHHVLPPSKCGCPGCRSTRNTDGEPSTITAPPTPGPERSYPDKPRSPLGGVPGYDENGVLTDPSYKGT